MPVVFGIGERSLVVTLPARRVALEKLVQLPDNLSPSHSPAPPRPYEIGLDSGMFLVVCGLLEVWKLRIQ